MSFFYNQLNALNPTDKHNRTWVYVPYDQLTDEVGPLSRIAPENLGIILIESTWKGSRRPYHKQKLAYVLSNGRQFALEQAKRGVAIRHLITTKSFASELSSQVAELGTILMMRPAERELRADLAVLVRQEKIEVQI